MVAEAICHPIYLGLISIQALVSALGLAPEEEIQGLLNGRNVLSNFTRALGIEELASCQLGYGGLVGEKFLYGWG